MERRNRTNITGGGLLILLGLLFLVYQLMPDRFSWLRMEASWPLIVVAVGVALLILGMAVGVPGMAIPASIVGGIGFVIDRFGSGSAGARHTSRRISPLNTLTAACAPTRPAANPGRA